MISTKILISTLTLAAFLTAHAEVKLPAVLADHMVVQRDRPVHLWGTASPGEKVHAEFRGAKADIIADEKGNWSLTLPKGSTGGPFPLTINTIHFTDILVGDVWLASGQSNMEFTLIGDPKRTGVVDVQKEIANVNLPSLRLFHVKADYAETPQTDVSVLHGWAAATAPEVVKGCSAVAYFFAKNIILNQKPGHQIPIGVIQSDLGSSPAETWISPDAFAADPTLEQHIPANIKALQQDAVKQAAGVHQPLAAGKDRKIFFLPSYLYNAMIAPLENFPITGVIWYQGEANSNPPDSAVFYHHVLSTLISDWRSHWHEGDIPFYFVQLANFQTKADWPDLRESQLLTLFTVPNTGMSVAIDIGEADSIHPRDKWDTGYRLSLWARAKVYGEKIEFSGPLFDKATISGNKITAHFSHADGLMAKGVAVKSVEVAGADGVFVPAEAKIDGKAIVASATTVSTPAFIRYAWAANPETPLYNSAGLPGSPFTSKPQ